MPRAKACKVRGCSSPRAARDLCRSHYRAAHARGEFTTPIVHRRQSGIVCPPEHKHGGTTTCYLHHRCECDGCFEAYSVRRKEYVRKRRYGRQTGTLVPALGVHRRIQALHARGWSYAEIAKRLEVTPEAIGITMTRKQVTPETARRVDDLYELLAMVLPPQSTVSERRAATYARNRATARGWLAPLAWDDIDADEGPAVVDVEEVMDEVRIDRAMRGIDVELTVAERRVVVERLNGLGYSDREIGDRLHLAARTILRIRVGSEIAPALNAARERIVA